MANDLAMLKLALAGGASAKNITSRYDGTALIAAAHLGHAEAVKLLIAAKAPLNHVNNLGWTALMESIVLGNGGGTTPPRWSRWSRPARRQHRRQAGRHAIAARPPARLCRDGADFGKRRRAMRRTQDDGHDRQLELSIALSENENTRAVLDGRIAPDAIKLHPTALHPSEMFWRQLKFAEFDVSEMSMSSLTIATSQGADTMGRAAGVHHA